VVYRELFDNSDGSNKVSRLKEGIGIRDMRELPGVYPDSKQAQARKSQMRAMFPKRARSKGYAGRRRFNAVLYRKKS